MQRKMGTRTALSKYWKFIIDFMAKATVLLGIIWNTKYLKNSFYLFFINILGILVYLLLEAWILAPRLEAEALNGIDDLFFWLTKEGPLLVGFLIINAIWLTAIIKINCSGRNWQTFFVWLSICLMWFGALFIRGSALIVGNILIKIFQ